MRKTGLGIEADVYTLIKNSSVKTAIQGTLYRDGMRPLNASTEDAIVSFLAGIDGEIQSGVLNLNIYVPDILVNEQYVKDISRCATLEALASIFIQELSVSGDYLFELDSMVQTFKVEGISQHFVNCRIKFSLSTI